MGKITTRLLPLLLVTASTGCYPWVESVDWDLPVWSDDGAQVAAVERVSEIRTKPLDLFSTKERRGWHFSVHFADVTAGPKVEAWYLESPLIQGRPWHLALRASQGYALVGSAIELDKGSNSPTEKWTWHRVSVKGVVKPITSASGPTGLKCPKAGGGKASIGVAGTPVQVLSSHKGDRLAALTLEHTCAEIKRTLRVYDANSLALLAGPLELPSLPFKVSASGEPNIAVVKLFWSKSDQWLYLVEQPAAPTSVLTGVKVSVSLKSVNKVSDVPMGCAWNTEPGGDNLGPGHWFVMNAYGQHHLEAAPAAAEPGCAL